MIADGRELNVGYAVFWRTRDLNVLGYVAECRARVVGAWREGHPGLPEGEMPEYDLWLVDRQVVKTTD